MRIVFQQATLLRIPLALAVLSTCQIQAATPLGIFQGHGDIGTVMHAGSVAYDSSTGSYTISASGENMWFTSDDFQFVWKKASGDISIAADIELVGHSGAPHRKAMLMIRQSLDPDSPYVDLAQHGIGKTALQFRDAKGAITHTIASYTYAPRRIELQKRGDFYYFFVSDKDGKLRPAGASTRLKLTAPFYVGLGVCAHERDAVRTAIFSHVTLNELRSSATPHVVLYSTLQTIFVRSGDRQVEYVAPGRLASPNWSHDGLFFIFNRGGKLFRIPVKCGEEDTGCAPETQPVRVATEFAAQIDNDHGISPNGQMLALSDMSPGDRFSSVYIVPIVGGYPLKVTESGQGWHWHGWSPDGKTLVLTGDQSGEMKDVYTTPAIGGHLTRLTTSNGINDGPEYSPDGKYIYFSSNRTGSMQIWRMRTDGGPQEQVLSDSLNDYYPHLSPDGQWIVYLSYDKKSAVRPEDSEVTLSLMSIKDKKVRLLATLLGGEGTIDAPSWSPDSSKIAFVTYTPYPCVSCGESSEVSARSAGHHSGPASSRHYGQ